MWGYQHTEVGYAVLGGLAFLLLLVALAQDSIYCTLERNVPVLIGWLLLALGAGLFGTLSVQLDDRQLTFGFGPGWLRMQLPVAEVVSCRTAKHRWRRMWHSRPAVKTVLCSLCGLRALEVTLRGGRTLLLGTNEPVKLLHAIAAASRPLMFGAPAGKYNAVWSAPWDGEIRKGWPLGQEE